MGYHPHFFAVKLSPGRRVREMVVKMRDEASKRGLVDMVNYTGLDGMVIVEVGSYAGESADVFASMGNVREIWCIDPWSPGYDENDIASGSDMSAAESEFDKVCAKHGGKIRKFKGTLDDFLCADLGVFPDLVYIDAKHEYESVLEDIRSSLKMNPEFISGHDYSECWKGVVKAVDEKFSFPDETFRDTSWIKRIRRGTAPFSVDEMFDNSFVLAKFPSELDRFYQRMGEQGFDRMPKPFFGNFPKYLVGEKGGRENYVMCALAHYCLVRMARTLDMPHVTIFESDCYPMKGCRERLDRLLQGGIPDDSDEIVYGNIQFIRDNRKFLKDVHSGFGRIRDHLWGAHAVTIFRKAYDTWMGNMLKCDFEIHADFFNELVGKCYSTDRSYFIQWKDKMEYPRHMTDSNWLSDFPS